MHSEKTAVCRPGPVLAYGPTGLLQKICPGHILKPEKLSVQRHPAKFDLNRRSRIFVAKRAKNSGTCNGNGPDAAGQGLIKGQSTVKFACWAIWAKTVNGDWDVEFYKKFWYGYFDFKGRTSPRDYWLAVLVNMAIFIVPVFFYDSDAEASLIGRLHVFYFLATIIPSIAIAVRRLHDINKSGFWLLAHFIPLGTLLVLFFHICKGDEGDNLYGPSPLATEGTAEGFSGTAGELALPHNTGGRISALPKAWKPLSFCFLLFLAVVVHPSFSGSKSVSAPEFTDDWIPFVLREDADDLAIYLKIKTTSPAESVNYPSLKGEASKSLVDQGKP